MYFSNAYLFESIIESVNSLIKRLQSFRVGEWKIIQTMQRLKMARIESILEGKALQVNFS